MTSVLFVGGWNCFASSSFSFPSPPFSSFCLLFYRGAKIAANNSTTTYVLAPLSVPVVDFLLLESIRRGKNEAVSLLMGTWRKKRLTLSSSPFTFHSLILLQHGLCKPWIKIFRVPSLTFIQLSLSCSWDSAFRYVSFSILQSSINLAFDTI